VVSRTGIVHLFTQQIGQAGTQRIVAADQETDEPGLCAFEVRDEPVSVPELGRPFVSEQHR